MIKRYNNLSLALGVPGIVLQLVGNGLAQANQNQGGGIAVLAGVLAAFAGTGLLVAGLVYYAKAKGRSSWWGLCGLLSCCGLIVLALLKDRAPDG